MALGPTRPDKPIELGDVTITLKSPFAVVVVSSLDDQPIASSKHWLVTALGNAVNTGMKLAPSGNQLADPGKAPVLIEPIAGRVALRELDAGGGGLRGYALDAAGARRQEVELTERGGGAVLELSAKHRTMHYEVVK